MLAHPLRHLRVRLSVDLDVSRFVDSLQLCDRVCHELAKAQVDPRARNARGAKEKQPIQVVAKQPEHAAPPLLRVHVVARHGAKQQGEPAIGRQHLQGIAVELHEDRVGQHCVQLVQEEQMRRVLQNPAPTRIA